MKKNNRKNHLFSIILISLLIISCLGFSLIPTIYAQEETIENKGLNVLDNVVGLDLTKCTVSTKEYPEDVQTLSFSNFAHENIQYDLSNGEKNAKILCTFASGNLQMIHVLENSENIIPFKSENQNNDIESAKSFLDNYKHFSNNSIYVDFKSLLDGLSDNENITLTSGNMQLEVIASSNNYTSDSRTTFKWTFVLDGAIAPSKFVTLGFKNGALSCFVDNWELYRIGNTDFNLSKEEAIEIALETAKNYPWNITLDNESVQVEQLNEKNIRWAKLIFDNPENEDKLHINDQLTLYPVWRIGIALDKWYGNLYGIEVHVWADTKTIRYVQEAWATLTPEEEETLKQFANTNEPNNQSVVTESTPLSLIWILSPLFVVSIIKIATICTRKKRKNPSYPFLRINFFGIGGILLISLMFSLSMTVPILQVNALNTGGAVIWGSESTGSYDPTLGHNWRKHPTEVSLQNSIANTIRGYFANNGYDAYDKQGSPGSLKSNVLSMISSIQSNHDSVAVVDFDHGVGNTQYSEAPGELHKLFEDNVGNVVGPLSNWTWQVDNGVYDMDIFPLTGSGKVSFALINTCLSADITYGQGPGTYGAIGMTYAWTHRLVEWIYGGNFNVQTDISSYGYHYPDTGSQCYIGFETGSASLMQPIPYDSGPQYHNWVNNLFYYGLNYDMSVIDALDHASYNQYGVYFGSSPLWQGFTCYWYNANPETYSGCRMLVYGNGNIHLQRTPIYSLSISAGTGGSTTPSPGTYWYDKGTNVQITANEYTNYDFSHWIINGYTYTQNPKTITINSNYNVQAVFVPEQQTTHQLTVLCYDNYNNPGYVPLYIDSQYVGTTMNTYTVTEGTHSLSVPEYVGGTHYFYGWYYDGGWHYSTTTSVSVYSDKTVTAYYMAYW